MSAPTDVCQCGHKAEITAKRNRCLVAECECTDHKPARGLPPESQGECCKEPSYYCATCCRYVLDSETCGSLGGYGDVHRKGKPHGTIYHAVASGGCGEVVTVKLPTAPQPAEPYAQGAETAEVCPNCGGEIIEGAQLYQCDVCGKDCCTPCSDNAVVCDACLGSRTPQSAAAAAASAARIAELGRQIAMDSECIERITQHGYELELKLSDVTRERDNWQSRHALEVESGLKLGIEGMEQRDKIRALDSEVLRVTACWSDARRDIDAARRERDEARASLAASETDRERLRAAAELGRQELDALWSFHGQNLQVYGWHLNGAAEPFDSFLDDNNKGALEALTTALAPALATEGESKIESAFRRGFRYGRSPNTFEAEAWTNYQNDPTK